MKKAAFFALLAVIVFLNAFAAVKPGVAVCADWGGSKYLATVVAVNGSSYDVIYADGDKATLTAGQICEIPWDPQLKNGDVVLASWNNSAMLYEGTVIATAQLSYQVKWADGSAPSWVPATKILKK